MPVASPAHRIDWYAGDQTDGKGFTVKVPLFRSKPMVQKTYDYLTAVEYHTLEFDSLGLLNKVGSLWDRNNQPAGKKGVVFRAFPRWAISFWVSNLVREYYFDSLGRFHHYRDYRLALSESAPALSQIEHQLGQKVPFIEFGKFNIGIIKVFDTSHFFADQLSGGKAGATVNIAGGIATPKQYDSTGRFVSTWATIQTLKPTKILAQGWDVTATAAYVTQDDPTQGSLPYSKDEVFGARSYDFFPFGGVSGYQKHISKTIAPQEVTDLRFEFGPAIIPDDPDKFTLTIFFGIHTAFLLTYNTFRMLDGSTTIWETDEGVVGGGPTTHVSISTGSAGPITSGEKDKLTGTNIVLEIKIDNSRFEDDEREWKFQTVRCVIHKNIP